MKCPSCGHQNASESAAFCGGCGKRLMPQVEPSGVSAAGPEPPLSLPSGIAPLPSEIRPAAQKRRPTWAIGASLTALCVLAAAAAGIAYWRQRPPPGPSTTPAAAVATPHASDTPPPPISTPIRNTSPSDNPAPSQPAPSQPAPGASVDTASAETTPNAPVDAAAAQPADGSTANAEAAPSSSAESVPSAQTAPISGAATATEPAPSPTAAPGAQVTPGQDNGAGGGANPGSAPAEAGPGRAHWTEQFERLENGPEADLLVRVGSISNLGFGWPDGFDPFSGQSTPAHAYPWDPPKDAPAGLKRIMVGSSVTPQDLNTRNGDGYSGYMVGHDTHVQPIKISLGQLPAKITGVLFQFFIDDFQAPHFGSHFQVSLNGTRIPAFEQAVNAVDQSGPIGKLVSLPLFPEYFDLLRSGTLSILIDDPVTHVPDGFAIDFVRVLVNPHALKYQVKLRGTVLDADSRKPVPGATVSAALAQAESSAGGAFALEGIPAGLVVATASKEGYADGVNSVDVEAGQVGQIELLLQRVKEDSATLAQQIARTGSATIYGIHFDLDKATLRPDSAPALQAVLAVIRGDPAAHWIVAGHTDNAGSREHNAALSLARAQAVCDWLQKAGVSPTALREVGFGSDHPVADNASASGRALNRRVELQRQ